MGWVGFGVPYFKGTCANVVWNNACEHLSQDQDNVTVSRDLKDGKHVTTRTKEALHATFLIENPRDRVVFSRPINPAFAVAEVLWILSGSKKADFLLFWNPRMKTWMDDDKTFHGAYGSRLGSRTTQRFPSDNGIADYFGADYYCKFDQLYYAYETLKNTSHSRQVVLQIWDNYRDFPSLSNNPVSKDVPCNVFADLKVRDGKLYWLQMMRSNDLIWGTPYNFIQWTCIQEIMAGWLGLELGYYIHVASSLHVYEKHWDHLKEITDNFVLEYPVNNDSLMIEGYYEWNIIFGKVLEIAVYLTQTKDDAKTIISNVQCDVTEIPVAYVNLCWLLCAEALRRKEYYQYANDVIEKTNCYWRTSWLNWRDFVDRGKGSYNLQEDQKELK